MSVTNKMKNPEVVLTRSKIARAPSLASPLVDRDGSPQDLFLDLFPTEVVGLKTAEPVASRHSTQHGQLVQYIAMFRL